MKATKIKNDVIWLVSSRFIYAFMQWLTVILIARLDDNDMLGLFTYSIAIVSPIVVFSQLNMKSFVITDVISKYKYDEYFTTRLIITIILLIISLLCIFLADTEPVLKWILFFVLLYKSVESISDILNAFLQKSEKMKLVALSVISRGIFLVGSISATYLVFDSLFLGLLFVLISWLLVLIFFDIPNSKKIGFKLKLDKKKSPRIIYDCFPLGIIGALISVGLYVPTYVIESNLGYKEVGVFVALMYFLQIGRMVMGSIIQAVAPKVSRICFESKKSSIIKLAMLLILSACFFAMLFIVCISYLGEDILKIVYGKEFVQYIDVLLILVYSGGMGFVNQFIGLLLMSMRSFKVMLSVQLIQVLIITYVCVTYIPVYGLIAAAYSIIAGSAILLLFNALFLYINIRNINR